MGDARVGTTLSVDASGVVDPDGLGEFRFQWLADGSVIEQATAPEYHVSADMTGQEISVRVDFVDGNGAPERLYSAPTEPVADSGASIVIADRSGTAMTGVTLHATAADGTIDEVGQSDAGGQVMFAPAATGEIRLTGSKPYVPEEDGNITALDALNVLRLAVGVTPSWGSAAPMDFVAADINQDGRVTALDALEVLRAAVGVQTANQPRWFFMDSDADLSHIDRNNTLVDEGIRFDPMTPHMSGLSMTGVLLGNMQEYLQ